jgi:hypothetical protein
MNAGPDTAHLRIVLLAGLVVVVQGRREDVTGPVQEPLQVGVHEVPIDGIGLTLQELAEHLDRPKLIIGKITEPTQVV